jgi:peptide-methionine (R)-S-oxide reductase
MSRRREWISKVAIGGLAAWIGGPARGTTAAPRRADALTLSDEQWRARLTPDQYRVLRREGTEPPFSSALNAEKRRGTYACVACGLPLFTSAMKFDSGTGWPSFFEALPGTLGFRTDYTLILPRTEYHCARCGGHHGHVFDDGPRPTGKRYCNNGVCLKFEPEAA